jgi:hypothetical protein
VVKPRWFRRRSDEEQHPFGPQDDSEGQATTDWPPSDPVPSQDWYGQSELEPEEDVPRHDVSLATMLMLGENPWQRIDGMGIARDALEAPATGDPRRDLSDQERFFLANGRAWCLLVHGDLAHMQQHDDPFVLADASRHAELARAIGPSNPLLHATFALLRFRQGRVPEALEAARGAVGAFASLPDRDRSGRTQGAAVLAVLTLALVTAASGDIAPARTLAGVAQAIRSPLDVDDAAFGALLAELSAWCDPPA